MRKTMPSTTESAIPDVPTPYTLKALIIRQTQALESHTRADDNWRETVMKMFDERLKEKDYLIDLIKQSCLRDEQDKTRWYRAFIFAMAIVAGFGGLDIANLVGLI